MTLAAQLMTADQLLALPKRGELYELVQGALRTRPLEGFEHGNVTAELQLYLHEFLNRNHLGVVVGPDTGFLLARDPDHVRAPDIAFVVAARVPSEPVFKYFPGAPDLAVEVLSPADTVIDLEEKIADLFTAGTKLVWVINPRTRTAAVHRPEQPVHQLRDAETLTAPDLLPGFECRIADLFT